MRKAATHSLPNLLAALVLTCSGSVVMADTIKIALAGPVTSPVADYGDMQFVGAKMAIENINAAGGVNGNNLEAVIFDDACDPKQAVAVANRIVSQNIRFVVGHLCSSSTQPASRIYEEEGILMVTAASTSPEITAHGHQLLFRTIGLDSLQGDIASDYIVNQIKPEKVAVLHDGKQYGQGIAGVVRSELSAAGLEVAFFEQISTEQQDFSELINQLQTAGVDFVYYGGYHIELGLLLRQSAELGFNARFMGPEGVGNSAISSIAGSAAEGLLVTLPKAFDQDPRNAELVQAFISRNEDPTGPFVFPAYAAVQVIAEGIRLAGNSEPPDVADALRNNSFETPIGTLEFDAKGDLQTFSFVVYRWHADASKTALTQ